MARGLRTSLVIFIGLLGVAIVAPLFWRSFFDQGTSPDSDGDVTITFAAARIYQSAYEPLINEFHTLHPTMQIAFVPLSDSLTGMDDMRELATAADTTVLPVLPQGAEVHYFLDLGAQLDSDISLDKSAFWPGAFSGCESSGRTVGLPVAVGASLILYDGATFDEAGLSHPAPGWTWDDFRRAADVLAQGPDSQTARYGFVDRALPLVLLGPLTDALLKSQDSASAAAALAQGISWYVDLVRAGAIPVFATDEDPVAASELLINARRAAMWVGGLGDYARLRAELGDQIGIAPYPVLGPDKSSSSNRVRATCLVVSAGTAHPQEAWQWVSFLTTRPIVQAQPDQVPARPSVAEAIGYWQTLDAPSAAALRYSLEHGWYGYITSEPYASIGRALTQAMAEHGDLEASLAAVPMTATSSSPTASGEIPLSVATAVGPAGSATVAADVVTIDYFADANYHTSTEVVRTLAEAYNRAHPGSYVRLWDSQTAFGTGGYGFRETAEKFDCFPGFSANTLPPNMWELVYDLQPLFEADADATALMSDIYPMQLDANRVGGQLYALPAASQPVVMYYNAEYLADLGLEPPEIDWSIAEFWQLANASAKDGRYGFVPIQWGEQGLEFLLAGEGAQLVDRSVEPPTAKLDDPAMLRVVTKLASMAEGQGIYPFDDGGARSFEGNSRQRLALLDAGRVAMWTNVAGHRYGGFAPPGGRPYSVGVVPVPLGVGPLAPSTQAIALFISRHAQNPGACWEWMKFLSTQPGVFLGIPARRSVTESPAYEVAVGPEAAASYRAVMSQPTRPLNSDQDLQSGKYESWVVVFWWQDALVDVFNGAEPAQALRVAQSKAEAYLSCMVAANGDDPEYWLTCARAADPDAKRFQAENQDAP